TGIAVWKASDNWAIENVEAAGGPLCPNGSRGACDDGQVGGYRVAPGGSSFIGDFDWPRGGPVSNMGYTLLLGYSKSIDSPPCTNGVCSLWQYAWKHDEFAPGSQEFFFGSQNGFDGGSTLQPFTPYFAPFDGSCPGAMTCVVGKCGCN